MKVLRITYGEQTVFDGEVEEYSCVENSGGIKVEGRLRRQPTAGGGGGGLSGVMNMIASASKARTAEYAAQKRAEATEPAEPAGPVVEPADTDTDESEETCDGQ